MNFITAMKTTQITREYRHIQVIYLHSFEKEVNEIGEIAQLIPKTISRLYTKYRSKGLTSISDAPHNGRPSHCLTENQEAMIKNIVLNKTPVDVGGFRRLQLNSGNCCSIFSQRIQLISIH